MAFISFIMALFSRWSNVQSFHFDSDEYLVDEVPSRCGDRCE